ncbi:polyketide synthase docking domain-containing protein, partial [Streptomyces rapamycinicus]|nr:hypothetical protein [Streptomyces rapamycinicus]
MTDSAGNEKLLEALRAALKQNQRLKWENEQLSSAAGEPL